MLAVAVLSWGTVEVLALIGVLVLTPLGFCLLIAPDEIDDTEE